jgi:hypothetical protein
MGMYRAYSFQNNLSVNHLSSTNYDKIECFIIEQEASGYDVNVIFVTIKKKKELYRQVYTNF